MKTSIIINTILPAFACLQLLRALYNSYILESKLHANKAELKERGLIYLLAENKILLQRIARLIIILLIISNVLLATWSLDRIINNYAAYATTFIGATAVLFHLIMAVIAQFVFLIYNSSDLSFLKHIKL